MINGSRGHECNCTEQEHADFGLIRTYIGARGGGTLAISWWGCAAGTLEPLTYTRASYAEFCCPILE